MKVDVILSADRITEAKVQDKVVVVIDVLRATSTIVTALANGCQKVLPVATIERAKKLTHNLPENCIVAGERGGKKIKEFDLGNSPRDFTTNSGNKVILTTTNGTKCFTRVESAAKVLIGSLINLRVLVNRISNQAEKVVFCCAGAEGEFALDDFVTAGKMIAQLMPDQELGLSDTSRAALGFYFQHRTNLQETIKTTASGRNLISQNKERDIDFILQTEYAVVPKYNRGEIKLD